MKLPPLASLALAALCALPVRAATTDCPGREALAPLLKADGLFLGEIHGSVEVPTLVECLAGRLADEFAGRRPLWVALELQPAALEASDPAWRKGFQDGRTSQAMLQLIRALKSLQSQGRLTLAGFVPADPPPGAAAYERAMARELDRAPAEAFVLALAGNVHARKSPGAARFSAQAAAPAGSLLQRRMTHMLIGHRLPSQAWICAPTCGPLPLGPSPEARDRAAGLHVLDDADYDYLLLLDRLSASPPAFPAPAAPKLVSPA
ncbi:hypothetical protein H5407_03445 [Mitsuaria sp. WAJ17]|uniref:hypothetical protein n=1 Tax=Mitsuaria sp. WAJ17 TaxID=2761452 RepID=UPI0015FF76BD|nr:hypothetical protein [Mitsuaria sp. WAJ17]MBB2484276.1 hypothetical protein [Mitsuaria sp. WAJ17]